jgi:hypothetical protein
MPPTRCRFYRALSSSCGLGQCPGAGRLRPGLQTIEAAAHGAAQPPFPSARVYRFPVLELPYPATEADFARHGDLPVHRSATESRASGRTIMRARTPGPLGVGNQAELLQHGDSVIDAKFLRDQAILHAQHGGASEAHLLARALRQGTDR